MQIQTSFYPVERMAGCLKIQQIGKLGRFCVLVLSHAKASLQNPFLACCSVIVSNIFFVQLASKVCQITYHFFNQVPLIQDELSQFELCGLACVFALAIGGLNFSLASGLKLPLSRFAVATLSAATVASSLFMNYWKNNR
ncbi:Conserved hypothetical membrane protein [Candidatus Protochlamydia naegleriophila]|uniref:Conserved hypothetical membrane protein n=1 Tax=Candidatus Protochlamydia naegleriophila TaxID=389348 RepID=A0A0U5EU31_9BACT|nr:hypothetical protein [Candidatus Protochlamydia naegleriophila]CUI17713.1 Conserved hypothetical membrane protein [Candidatus Protochlamydia naegleriophila]